MVRSKASLRAVVLAATKGGVGKTTLASVLAVRAAEDGARVALIDTDPQASLIRWWELRGEPENPKIYEMDASAEAIGLLMAEGWDWVFIDTPPAMFDRIEAAVAIADFVLIPSRTSAIDVEAAADVVDLCREHGKKFAFLINQANPQWGKLTDSTEDYLRRHGPVLAARIGYRKAFVSAMTVGKSGVEIEKDGQCRKEVDALWAALKKSVGKAMVRA